MIRHVIFVPRLATIGPMQYLSPAGDSYAATARLTDAPINFEGPSLSAARPPMPNCRKFAVNFTFAIRASTRGFGNFLRCVGELIRAGKLRTAREFRVTKRSCAMEGGQLALKASPADCKRVPLLPAKHRAPEKVISRGSILDGGGMRRPLEKWPSW